MSRTSSRQHYRQGCRKSEVHGYRGRESRRLKVGQGRGMDPEYNGRANQRKVEGTSWPTAMAMPASEYGTASSPSRTEHMSQPAIGGPRGSANGRRCLSTT